ncbi:hypothetical protein [Angustibacter luteus]|uniref:Uncharacterized protein n=1 Tax=Angustibacter luteus TaxID=658456 RepID=A0ABW1JHF3_9ACTN
MGIAARSGQLLTRVGAASLSALGARVVPLPSPVPPSLQHLCATLHRLDDEIARLRVSDRRTPALFHRLQSATRAYDLVLCDTCRAVGVLPPGEAPFNAVARLEIEAGLAAAGVDW